MRRLVVLAFLLLSPAVAQAQSGAASLVAPAWARQAGLDRMWFTQISLDRGRGRLAGLNMHVSATQSHTVVQVAHDGRRYVFSERDRDAFGKEIGALGAKKLAEEKVEEIKKELTAAGKADAAEPAVETFVVPKITLYASSHRGSVHALDGETGRTLWTTSIGNPLYPTTAPAANDRFVAVCNGSTIYVMRATDGSVVWNKPAIGSPGAGPALSEDLLFVPMVSGQVESLLLEDPRMPVQVYKSFGRTMVQPVASSNSVAWPTDAGNLYVSLANAPGIRFRMQATESINAAPAFLPPDKILAASLDGYVYCVHERRGNIIWRFTTGERIEHSPIALGESAYVISKRGNMYAIDVATAAERWVIGGIQSYLAGTEKRLYCLDARGDLVILDSATGSRLATIPGLNADLPLINAQTDRIFLVSSSGLVQALRETNQPFPLVHYMIEPQQRVVRPMPKTGPKSGAPTTTEAPVPATDPFGASPMAPPAGSPPAAAPDPFANP
jgi:outer membrane protein assembly factor BamB